MCANMNELKEISQQIYELEKEKAAKKKELDDLELKIKQLKNESSSYMKKRQKDKLTVNGLDILFSAFTRSTFDKEAFIASEENGAEKYNKYCKVTSVERLTVRLAKA